MLALLIVSGVSLFAIFFITCVNRRWQPGKVQPYDKDHDQPSDLGTDDKYAKPYSNY